MAEVPCRGMGCSIGMAKAMVDWGVLGGSGREGSASVAIAWAAIALAWIVVQAILSAGVGACLYD